MKELLSLGMFKNAYGQGCRTTILEKEKPQINRTQQITERLHEKMSREYIAFYDKLLTLEPKQIIERAYEKATKDEIMGCIGTLELPYGQALSLYKSPIPLEECYQRWLKSDTNQIPDIHHCIGEVAKILERERSSKAQEGR